MSRKLADLVHPMTGRPPADAWPVRTGGSTGLVGSFGYTRSGGKRMHKGIDWLAKEWAPVYAAHDGLIVRGGFECDNFGIEHNIGYGSRTWLRQGDEIETRYCHLVMQVYRQGMRVEAGAVIGYVGRTGNCGTDLVKVPTHEHFETRIREGGKLIPVNPEWYLHGEPHRKFGVPEAT